MTNSIFVYELQIKIMLEPGKFCMLWCWTDCNKMCIYGAFNPTLSNIEYKVSVYTLLKQPLVFFLKWRLHWRQDRLCGRRYWKHMCLPITLEQGKFRMLWCWTDYNKMSIYGAFNHTLNNIQHLHLVETTRYWKHRCLQRHLNTCIA